MHGWSGNGRIDPGWVTDGELAEARRRSPEHVLQRHCLGVRVERQGRSIVVQNVLRADLVGDRWVGCEWGGAGIGDAVAMVRYVLGCSFVAAVRHLIGTAPPEEAASSFPPNRTSKARRPRLPLEAAPRAGRAYLASRGISDDVILAAEAGGSVHYLRDGVAFLGRDLDLGLRSATVRYFQPKFHKTDGELTKRDLRGSDKAFPVIFEGCPDRAVVVEGDLTGLAVQCLAAAKGRPFPAVIVTGGVNALRWIGEERSRASWLALNAKELIVAGEREIRVGGEVDAEKQARTDEARSRLLDSLANVRQGPASPGLPSAGCRDGAEWLAMRQARQGGEAT